MLTSTITMNGKIDSKITVRGEIASSIKFTGSVKTGMSDIQRYSGSYEIEPDAHDPVIVECANLVMSDNLTVKKIRTAQTPNVYGDTLYIASEV